MNSDSDELQVKIQSLSQALGTERVKLYVDFLNEIFSLIPAHHDERTKIYSFLQKQISLINDELVEVIESYIPFVLNKLNSDEARQVYVEVVAYFADLIHDFDLGSETFNIEIQISCRKIVSDIFQNLSLFERWATVQANLAENYQSRILGNQVENLRCAAQCCHNSLQVFNGEDFPQEWTTLHFRLACIYDKDCEKCIHHLNSALQFIDCRSFSELWAIIQNKLGKTYKKQGNLDQAIFHYENALQVLTSELHSEQYAYTSSELGIAYSDQGEFMKAYQHLSVAIEEIEKLRGEIATGLRAKQEFDHGWIVAYQKTIEVCIEISLTDPSFKGKALEYIEISKIRDLVDLIVASKNIQEGQDLNAERQEIDIASRYIWMGDFLTQFSTYIETKLEQGELPELAKLRSELREKYPTNERSKLDTQQNLKKYLYQGLNKLEMINQDKQAQETLQSTIQINDQEKFQPVSYQEVINLIPDNNTIILQWHISLSSKSIFAFVISSDFEYPLIWRSSEKQFNDLKSLDSRYLAEYSINQGKNNKLIDILRFLSDILDIKKVYSLIPKSCTQIILIPDRSLYLYPLHALFLSDDTYLIDKFSRGVRYSPSCTILQLSQRQANGKFSDFFGIQNPTNDLHYSNLEVNVSASLFESSQLISDQKATKSTLLNSDFFFSANCIHFSCHGYFNIVSPRESKLFLAENTCLTLNDICNLRLKHCQLAVLSACETGLTEHLTPNNEYNSLSSGFIVAGSSSVVSSLWPVDQISTAFLFIRFYQNLKKCREVKEGAVANALHDAQVWLRELTSEEGEILLAQLKPHFNVAYLEKPKTYQVLERAAIKRITSEKRPFSDPFYWAAFVAIGC